ncbi:uncharacterized protein LOC133706829 [Rosa rugosa]|uniref:uncharacterized protein LOC133706829 n=1 Tax=Rosa rugosa TaxID=74645 RepID=UPI002B40312B|nr:uncharacterized protein LOC133706829 [Rosa rugosa]
MDKFVSSKARQATLNSSFKKEERRNVCRAIGRLFYTSAIAFNVANNPYYFAALEQVSKYGPGFQPPTSHELRTWILKEEVVDVQKMMLEHKKDWSHCGCTIMSDGWTDGKSRVILNFLVNSPRGTWFLKSVDASDTIKNGELMLNYLDSVVEEVGEENVVQIVTDNASNYKWAGKELMKHRSKLWWTPCAAHCIDLMLEDISKLKVFETTIQRAKQIVKFIYGHTQVLSIMRKFTENKEIIRPAVTRFATSFLSLQSLYKQKEALISMFSSTDWNECGCTKHKDANDVRKWILHDGSFWNHVAYCIKSVLPLVCVLREVDSEVRPAMGFIYELMDAAKEKIAKNLGNVEVKYGPIWRRIDNRWSPQLHQPLHAAGYYLNPQFRYEENFSNTEHVKKGLEECMDRMLVGEDRIKAEIQLDLYERKLGKFGSEMALSTRKKRSPVFWWEKYGTQTPELMNFATRVLSLTCSASGCERNLSTFEMVSFLSLLS